MAKRRASGEGNIRKRKDGRWEGRYTAGHDPRTGKRITKNVLGKTQAEESRSSIPPSRLAEIDLQRIYKNITKIRVHPHRPENSPELSCKMS